MNLQSIFEKNENRAVAIFVVLVVIAHLVVLRMLEVI
jgi:hypothetical protein